MIPWLLLPLLQGEKPVTTILWNGDSHPVGVGWVNTDKPTLRVSTERDRQHRKGRFNRFVCTESKKYAECGWQWAPWNPEFRGTDLSDYTSIEFSFRIQGKNLPDDFQFSLRSPGDHHLSKLLSLKQRVPNLYDGKWHRVRYPLADLYFPEMKLEPNHVIQVIFGAWNESGEFTFDFDDIAITKGLPSSRK